jgi:hypothetical protein
LRRIARIGKLRPVSSHLEMADARAALEAFLPDDLRVRLREAQARARVDLPWECER